MREFEEHHKWNVITWFFGSSPCFPSNFGISNDKFTGMGGHEGLCQIGSLINLDKSGKSKFARKVTVGWVAHTGNIDMAYNYQ